MSGLFKDLRYGVRMMAARPGFTLVITLTLALGIGANTAIFSVVNALLLSQLPFHQADRLAVIWQTSLKNPAVEDVTSYPNYSDWRKMSDAFEDMAVFRHSSATLTGFGEAERVDAGRVTASFLPVLHVTPAIGRNFSPDEEKPGSGQSVILSDSFWRQHFSADANVVGKSIVLDGTSFTVIGVLPADFNFPLGLSDVGMLESVALDTTNLSERGADVFACIGRLSPGVSLAAAQTKMDVLSASLRQTYPDTNTDVGAHVVGLQDQLVGGVAKPLRLLLLAVGLLLLIACANVANLLLARAQGRQREIAIRTAIGAGRARLIRQLLTESLTLSSAGAIAGLLLGTWGIQVLKHFLPENFPHFNPITLNGKVLFFTLSAAACTTFIFGLAPAIRLSKPDLNETLKEGGRGSTVGGGSRLRSGLAIAEIAISVVLLVGAGLLLRSFVNLTSVKPGFNPANVLSAYVALPRSKYAKDTQRIEFVSQVLDRVRALPGVVSANFSGPAPFTNSELDITVTIEGRPAPPAGQEPVADVQVVTPGYFNTMQIPLKRGREFANTDIKGGIGSMIINETMAKRYWPDSDPVGQFVSNIGLTADKGEPDRYQIIGVVADVKYAQLDKNPEPTMYFAHKQKSFPWGYLAVRTTTDPLALAPEVRAQVRAIDPDVPVSKIKTMDQMISGTVAQPRLFALLLSIFAFVGLSLAAIGIYGVVSYSVAERAHEFGVRMALGANRAALLRTVLGRAAVMAVAGVGLGLVAALGLSSLVESLLYNVSATDQTTFIVIGGVLSLIMLVASYIPARRATSVDPMTVLRSE